MIRSVPHVVVGTVTKAESLAHLTSLTELRYPATSSIGTDVVTTVGRTF